MYTDPIAFFITWTCYGTHLPGASDGWTKWHKGEQLAQPRLEAWCHDQMADSAIVLSSGQREIVEEVIRSHCEIRNWTLHAVNCRTNHCHVVVTAIEYAGEVVRDQFKAWSTRKLKEDERASSKSPRDKWWTRNGSVRHLFDEDSLEAAILYTRDAQEKGGSKADEG